MIERDIIIINRLGLHARAAAKLVDCASRYGARVEVGKVGQWVDAKSIMAVMMLAAGQGTTVSLRCDGDDETAAMDALVALIEDYFGEGE